MKLADLNSLLQADAKATYKQWTETLMLLRQITNTGARHMMESELKELYIKAHELRSTNKLNGMNLSMMNIILSRSVDQWCVLNRNPRSSII